MSQSPTESLVRHPLTLTTVPSLIEHPAEVYLSGLGEGSRDTMRQALNAIAFLLSENGCDATTLDWAKLRYKHTAALRAVLVERYASRTANKMLSALRRVLKEALRLELMDTKDYARAVDISNIKVSKELRGRALTPQEIARLMEVCLNDPTLPKRLLSSHCIFRVVPLGGSSEAWTHSSHVGALSHAFQVATSIRACPCIQTA